MKFLKFFNQIFESITNNKLINDWILIFNHNNKHNLDEKLKHRTNASETQFNIFINKIIKIIDSEELDDVFVFISFKLSIKIITHINLKERKMLIVTILGSNELIKETENIKIIN